MIYRLFPPQIQCIIFSFQKMGVVPVYAAISALYFTCVVITVISCPEKPSFAPKTNIGRLNMSKLD